MKEMKIPEKGISGEVLLEELKTAKGGDVCWENGRMFSLIYNAGKEIIDLGVEAYSSFLVENGLSPFAFKSLKKLETEVAAMCCGMMNGGRDAVGSMTCGGTESIFMAVKTARDHAVVERKITSGLNIVIPLTAHPAFDKAAHYLGLEVRHVPVNENFRAEPAAMASATDAGTILMAGSAMTYPHGVVDPIKELAAVAAEKNIWFHVDSCLGGFVLPFAKKLGYPIPDFDFNVPGVISMSADIHKYGFAPKGASIVMYRSAKYRRFQYFAYADWPGGVYGTSTFAGARTGGAIAGAWTVMRHLGEDGYMKLVDRTMKTTKKLMDGVRSIDGLKVMGTPDATVFAIGSDTLNVYALSDELGERGWLLEKQHQPPCLHLTVSPFHSEIADEFLAVLAEATDRIRGKDASKISQEAAMYGMMATMPDRNLARDLAVQYLNDLYRLE